ncbi:MAG: hypothetical protein QM831_05610 [Kofleriaceae bacterium]
MKIPCGIALLTVIGTSACRDTPAPEPTPAKRDAGSAIPDAAGRPAAPRSERPLGLADQQAWEWRARAGHPVFREARKLEDAHDWAGVAAACDRALAADPTNLEAAWLAAVAYAKIGQNDRVTAPLILAGTGDFGKWGLASLEQPGLKPYLETDAGKAWRAEVEPLRSRFVSAIKDGVRVIAHGDVFAVTKDRWYRLTRTYGSVVAVYGVDDTHLAYVTRGKKSGRRGVGYIDLSTGITGKPQPIGDGPAQLAWSGKDNGFYVAQDKLKKLLTLADGPAQGTLIATSLTTRPSGSWLEIYKTSGTRLHRTAPNIAADWDGSGLASAMRITSSNRTVTLPGQIVGDSIVWSADKNRLATLVVIDAAPRAETCTVDVFAIDATTGAQTKLSSGGRNIGVAWIANRTLAIAGDDHVELRSLDGATTPITGAASLAQARFTPHCRAEPEPEPAEPDEPPDDTGESATEN